MGCPSQQSSGVSGPTLRVPSHPQGSRTLPWAPNAVLRGPQCLGGFRSCACSLTGLEGPRPYLRVRIRLAGVSWERTAAPTIQRAERRAGFKQRPSHPDQCRLRPPGKIQNTWSGKDPGNPGCPRDAVEGLVFTENFSFTHSLINVCRKPGPSDVSC